MLPKQVKAIELKLNLASLYSLQELPMADFFCCWKPSSCVEMNSSKLRRVVARSGKGAIPSAFAPRQHLRSDFHKIWRRRLSNSNGSWLPLAWMKLYNSSLNRTEPFTSKKKSSLWISVSTNHVKTTSGDRTFPGWWLTSLPSGGDDEEII